MSSCRRRRRRDTTVAPPQHRVHAHDTADSDPYQSNDVPLTRPRRSKVAAVVRKRKRSNHNRTQAWLHLTHTRPKIQGSVTGTGRWPGRAGPSECPSEWRSAKRHMSLTLSQTLFHILPNGEFHILIILSSNHFFSQIFFFLPPFSFNAFWALTDITPPTTSPPPPPQFPWALSDDRFTWHAAPQWRIDRARTNQRR